MNSFFSLEGFAHRALFDKCQFAWEPLIHLASYLKGQELGKIEVSIPAGVHLVKPELISIGKGTRIEPGAYLEGPCIIGENCVIRHGAYLRGNVVVGNGCIVGHDTEIKHSILLDGAAASHFNYVGDSILGNRANLGAGVKCANLRLDHQMVSVVYQGKKILTQLKKLGAIVGDDAQLGCNSVTNPGTLLGKKALCHPCLNIGGFIPPHAIAKPSYKSIVDVHNLSH